MAGQFTGMDIAGVRTMATQLNTKAESIQTIMTELSSLLTNTQWVGPDQTRFIGDWQSTHVTALNNVITGLKDASTKATQNANEQESASNT